MKKFLKIVLLLFTVAPVSYFLFFIGFVSYSAFSSFTGNQSTEVFSLFPFIFVCHFSVILLIFALTAFYVVAVVRNERIDGDRKALWAVVIFMGNVIAFPIYWFLYIWREPAVDAKKKTVRKTVKSTTKKKTARK